MIAPSSNTIVGMIVLPSLWSSTNLRATSSCSTSTHLYSTCWSPRKRFARLQSEHQLLPMTVTWCATWFPLFAFASALFPPEVPFSPAVGRQHDRDGPIALELNTHVRPERSLRDRRVRAAEHAAEGIEQPPAELRWGGVREIRPPPVADVPVERELRNDEHRATRVEDVLVQ